MKAKIFMGIIIGCLTISLVGLLVSQKVQAQSSAGPGYWAEGLGELMWVKFAEDHMRQHGKQIQSYCITGSTSWVLVDTVPSNRRFVITDSIAYEMVDVFYSVDSGSVEKARISGVQNPHSFLSGIVFEPDESIFIKCNGASKVTISGYWVDLP